MTAPTSKPRCCHPTPDRLFLGLLVASAGVMEHSGIKIPYFAFFAHDSGLRPRPAPVSMQAAMIIAATLCVAIGCFRFVPSIFFPPNERATLQAELRLPTGKPGREGSKALLALLDSPDPDVLLLISTGEWKAEMRKSKWARELAAAGILVEIWPVKMQQLPGWIRQRMAAAGLENCQHP